MLSLSLQRGTAHLAMNLRTVGAQLYQPKALDTRPMPRTMANTYT